MNIVELKKSIADLQHQGFWNESIELMQTSGIMNGNAQLDLVYITETYYLLRDKDELDVNTNQQPKGYKNIKWDFGSTFGETVEYAFQNYKDDLMTQWILGTLMENVNIPFLLYTKLDPWDCAPALKARAGKLSENTRIEKIVKYTTAKTPSPITEAEANELVKELDMVGFCENDADVELYSYYKDSIQDGVNRMLYPDIYKQTMALEERIRKLMKELTHPTT